MNQLVASVLDSFQQNFATKENLSFTIALSGGVDSVVLLHILHEIFKMDSRLRGNDSSTRRNNNTNESGSNTLVNAKVSSKSTKAIFQHNPENQFSLEAIHINHGISPNSKVWANFCANWCKELNIPLKICNHVITKSGGESLENNARIIRYTEFTQHSSDVIILAHHKTDQVETVLSQIFRGSDLHNIASMRSVTQKQNKIFWRPLLNINKNDLEAYAKEHGLQYITDESNSDKSYLRNFIRNDVIPLLKDWDEHIAQKILNLQEQVEDTIALVDEIAKIDLDRVMNHTQDFIELDKFKILSTLRQTNLLKFFILSQDLPLPSKRQIDEFVRQINTCQLDRSPKLAIGKNHHLQMRKKLISILLL